VGADRRDAQMQTGGDLRGRSSARCQVQNLTLALRQEWTLANLLSRPNVPREGDVELRREQDLASRYRGDRVADLSWFGCFEQISGCSYSECRVQALCVLRPREEEHSGPNLTGPQRGHDLQAIETGHPDVEHGDIWLPRRDRLQSRSTVADLSDDFEVYALRDRPREACPIDRMVVG